MKKIELLLPSGDWNSIKAAVENGADAVYLGTDKFNARLRARNFQLSDIKEVTDYCHANGVRVYCTINILVKNSEICDFFQTIKSLYNSNIDAVIIQEISFINIIKKEFPGLEVHLSTQSCISNSNFKPLIEQADRVILPRELSCDRIKNFIERTNLPVEIFVQGALCFCISGKCLFSGILGGRSANRGLCAQPCRKRYNGEYLLSMKDLCLIEQIPQMIKAGISSLKIEGRLRSPKYVAAATKLYRTAIDSYYAGKFSIQIKLLKELELSFNREFTKGYFTGETNVVSPETPTSRGLFLGTIKTGNMIQLKEELSVGDGLGIWLEDRVDGAIVKRMEINKKNISKANPGDKVKLFIHAPENTKIYKTSSIEQPIEISFKKNNPITLDRKQVTTDIDFKQNNKEPNTNQTNNKEFLEKEELLVKVYNTEDGLSAYKNGADKVFYNLFNDDFNNKFSAYIPLFLKDKDVKSAITKINELKIKDVLVGDLGAYAKLKNQNLNLYLHYSNNIFNEIDINFFDNAFPIISPELSFSELKQFKNKNFGVLVHGKIVLMNTLYKNLPSKIKDDKGFTFPVRKEHNTFQILNSIELGLFQKILPLKEEGIKKYLLDLDSNVANTVKIYKEILENKQPEYNKKKFTKGYWDKGVY